MIYVHCIKVYMHRPTGSMHKDKERAFFFFIGACSVRGTVVAHHVTSHTLHAREVFHWAEAGSEYQDVLQCWERGGTQGDIFSFPDTPATSLPVQLLYLCHAAQLQPFSTQAELYERGTTWYPHIFEWGVRVLVVVVVGFQLIFFPDMRQFSCSFFFFFLLQLWGSSSVVTSNGDLMALSCQWFHPSLETHFARKCVSLWGRGAFRKYVLWNKNMTWWRQILKKNKKLFGAFMQTFFANIFSIILL